MESVIVPGLVCARAECATDAASEPTSSSRLEIIGCLRGGCSLRSTLRNLRGDGFAVIERVEEKLERAVRLRAERDLRSEQQHAALAGGHVSHRHAAIEVPLAPRPSAAQRSRAREPCDPAESEVGAE